jgi:hypothetical protein
VVGPEYVGRFSRVLRWWGQGGAWWGGGATRRVS